MRKKLLVKCMGITNPRWRSYNSGVGRSTSLLMDAVAKLKDIPFDIELYANGISSFGFDYNNWPFKHHSFVVPQKYGNNRLMLEPTYRTIVLKNDLLHIPHNTDYVKDNERFVVTMHDVIGYDNAKKTGNKKEIDLWERMAHKSLGIVTCSNFSKKEIVDRFHIDPNKVTVIYWGICFDKFYKIKADVLKSKLGELNIDYAYFISISCAHPRKNTRTLLKAYKEFAKTKPRHKLVLVWGNPPADVINEYKEEIKKKQVVFLDYVTDEQLTILYNGASCTMFPTRAEGFGFPILESFACGTPIMTCRNTCLEEVGKNVALYVGEDNIKEMVDVMTMFEKDEFDFSTFKRQSSELLKDFSWEVTAEKYIEFYNKYL